MYKFMNRYVLERPTMKKKIGFYVLLLYVYVYIRYYGKVDEVKECFVGVS